LSGDIVKWQLKTVRTSIYVLGIVVALSLFGLMLTLGMGWAGDYSDKTVESGKSIGVFGTALVLECPESWSGRVTDYLPFPQWTKLGQAASVGLKQTITLRSQEDFKTAVIASYYNNSTWQTSLGEERIIAQSLDLSSTPFESHSSQGFALLDDEGSLTLSIYLPFDKEQGATVFTFTHQEPGDSSAKEVLESFVSVLGLQAKY
jgi:hypothetical protein